MTVNRNRCTTWQENESLDIDGVSLEEAGKILAGLASKYGEDAIIEKLERKYEEGEYYAVMTQRMETDEEMTKRIRREEATEHYQRQEYERLKRKFEGEGK